MGERDCENEECRLRFRSMKDQIWGETKKGSGGNLGGKVGAVAEMARTQRTREKKKRN